MTQVKITVLKRTLNPEIAEEHRKEAKGLCEILSEGQEFMAEETAPYGPPRNFCPFAWNDIYKYFMALKQDGGFGDAMIKENTVIACCTDGVRPVIFKLTRLDD